MGGDERESHSEIDKEKRQRRLVCLDAHLQYACMSHWMSLFVPETVHRSNEVKYIGDITTFSMAADRNEASTQMKLWVYYKLRGILWVKYMFNHDNRMARMH